jgi:transcriptional regulator with XRE-family HTH domain
MRDLPVMKTNAGRASDRAVAGWGRNRVFPTYACALGGKIIPLEIELRRPYHISLFYHRGSGRIPRIRHMTDRLTEACTPAKYPWLNHEFLDPSDCKAVYKGETLTHYSGAPRPKDGKTRMNRSVAKKMKQRSAGKPDIELGKRIRLRRVEQHISQAELGDKLGVSFQQVQKYEKGVNRVGAARLQQIATALDVPVTFFYDGDGKAREVESLLFLDSAFSLRLLRAYSKIKDQTVQRQLVSLMESIAANED